MKGRKGRVGRGEERGAAWRANRSLIESVSQTNRSRGRERKGRKEKGRLGGATAQMLKMTTTVCTINTFFLSPPRFAVSLARRGKLVAKFCSRT